MRCYCCRAGTPNVIPDDDWSGIWRAYCRLAQESCGYCSAPMCARGCFLTIGFAAVTSFYAALAWVLS